jgi:hypothetical protein
VKKFWFEKYIGINWVTYIGTTDEFRIGLTLGMSNDLFLGFLIIGISNSI